MLQFMVSQRVGYNLATEPQQQTLDGLGSGGGEKGQAWPREGSHTSSYPPSSMSLRMGWSRLYCPWGPGAWEAGFGFSAVTGCRQPGLP